MNLGRLLPRSVDIPHQVWPGGVGGKEAWRPALHARLWEVSVRLQSGRNANLCQGIILRRTVISQLILSDRKSQVRQYLGFCSAESQANEDQKSAVLKPKHFLTLDFQSALIIWQNFSDWESGEGHEHGDTEQSLSLHCLWLAHHYQWFLAEPSGKLWHYSVVIVLLSCKNYLPSYRTTVTIYQLPLELNHGMAHAPTIPAHWPRCSWTRARPGDKYRASSCLCQVCGRV